MNYAIPKKVNDIVTVFSQNPENINNLIQTGK